MIRLFLSSVGHGLTNLRTQIDADLRTGGFEVVKMEIFGARPELPLDTCLAEIRKCDAAIIVVGPRYGSLTPAGDVSFTHEEFREAGRRGIPVLAFVLDPVEDASKEERARLCEFIREVRQAGTYKKTDPESLRAAIVATLLQRIQVGDLGPRFTFFQNYDEFFARQLQDQQLFNHMLPLVGRDRQMSDLAAFMRSDAPALVMTAPGGAGKSRLLLELAQRNEQERGVPRLRFVAPEARWTPEDIVELPTTSVVVVVDDAHRRSDLDTLIDGCLAQNPSARFLVTCRPALVDGVRHHLRAIERVDVRTASIRLEQLDRGDAICLARAALTDAFAGLAERLVNVSGGNPLVVIVGGRCIARERVAPELLGGTPEEFRHTVLEHLLDDQFLGGIEGQIRRAVLDVLAVIGPVSVEDRTVPESIAGFLDRRPHEVEVVLADLELHGLLLRRGRLARVTPDVLADHLLFCKAISSVGRPTGFVDEIFEAFAPAYLGNILANAAELDWRSAALSESAAVLARTWENIQAQLPGLSHTARAGLVSNLHRAAIYNPDRVLEVLEWFGRNPEAPEDPMLTRLGLSGKDEYLQDRICELLGLVATHRNSTKRCVDYLCELAPGDDRRTNSYPAHPRRVLEHLAGYEIRRSSECQQTVVETIRDLVQRATADTPVAWAAPILGAALVRSGESHIGTRQGVTIETYPLNQWLDRIAPTREAAIATLVSMANRDLTGDAAAALDELARLLGVPRGSFGREVEKDEIQAWLPEANRTTEHLRDLARTAPLDVIRYLSKRILRDFRHDLWPELAVAVEANLHQTPTLDDEAFFDLCVGLPFDVRAEDYQAEDARVARCATEVARRLCGQHDELSEVLETVVTKVRAVGEARRIDSMNHWKLSRALAQEYGERVHDWARTIVQHPAAEAHRLFPAALEIAKKRQTEQNLFEELIGAVCESPHEELRAQTANAFGFLVTPESAELMDLRLLERFLTDPSPYVRRAAIRPLGQFRERHLAEAIEAVVSVELGDDPRLADEVYGLFCRHGKFDPVQLTDSQIDDLLAKLESLPQLESRDHNLLEFVAYTSKRRPRMVVEVLLSRIQARARHAKGSGDDRFTPIPVGGHGLSLPGLPESPEYFELLRQIRDAALPPDFLTRHDLSTLFLAATSLKAAAEILSEWSTTDDPEKVKAAASLLRNFHEGVVFALDDFVADTLDNAAKLGHHIYESVKGQFFAVAISGIWTSARGQPSQRHLSDKKLATDMAEKYADRPDVHQFYEGLAQHAESCIRRDMAEFEEEDLE